jgi:integrase
MASGKPHRDFPLFPHATGRWTKKIRGKFAYFGKVADDPDGQKALALWLEQKDDLLAGRTPRVRAEGFTLRELLDRFVVSKRHLLDTREISAKHFAELYGTCRRIGDAFGLNRLVIDLASDDFERLRKSIAKQWGPTRLGNEVQRVRSVFKFGYDAGLIDRPVRFGPGFKKPTRKVMRQNRAKNGVRMFETDELRTIIATATQPMKAMILLGANCGFGNGDVANLPLNALDLQGGWVTFPRPKTGINRRIPLWPETTAALKDAVDARPRAKSSADAGLVFITVQGNRWEKAAISDPDPDTGKIRIMNNNSVTQQFSKLLRRLKLKRPGLAFYGLRHTFETVAGASKDQVATDAIMGHVDSSMAANYRERIDDDRLKAVVDYVRKWLFPVENKEHSK